MPYTFELYFTGLCCFHLLPSPENPEKVRVLMVRAGHEPEDPDGKDRPHHGEAAREGDHHAGQGGEGHDSHLHVPYLSVPVRNMIQMGDPAPWPERVVPAPDGLDCALYDLTGKTVSLDSPEAGGVRLSLGRKKQAKPKNEREGLWFDWITVLKAMDLRIKGLKEGCLGPTPTRAVPAVAAAVDVSFGELWTYELGRRGNQLFEFDFRRYDGREAGAENGGTAAEAIPRCISDRLVLRAQSLEDPVIVRMDGDAAFGIGPESLSSKSTVRAAATNFRTTFRRERAPAIQDFVHYYDLVEWREDAVHSGQVPPRESMIIPWVTQAVQGGHTPSTGSCPPSSGGSS